MRAVDIIIKKRDGLALSKQEIEFFVHGYTQDEIPDYQAAAWAMAVLLNGMSQQETTDLTLAMAASGDTLDLHDVASIVVDKHSTGGVGDKTTLVVAPMVAACGLPVGKMSGRGLGFSGGTLDKLESIPGYQVDQSLAAFKAQLSTVGLIVAGQTKDLAPADGKLYALRDVTGTVPSLPLIASSIMSKKIASGADAIVLDVKAGRGAFMKTVEEATKLAEMMVDIGQSLGRRVAAVISDMSQPLGNAVGNALEVVEAVDTLRGRGPKDLIEHCLAIAGQMLLLGDRADDEASAQAMLIDALNSGRAMQKFVEWIDTQGGDTCMLGDPLSLQGAEIVRSVPAPRAGVIAAIDAMEVGLVAVDLGAGRRIKGEAIDHAVGIVLGAKVGDRVTADDELFTIHANDADAFDQARQRLLAAYTWSDEHVDVPPITYDIVG